MAHQENDSREVTPIIEVEMTWCGGDGVPPPGKETPVIDLPMKSAGDCAVDPEAQDYWPHLPATDSYR